MLLFVVANKNLESSHASMAAKWSDDPTNEPSLMKVPVIDKRLAVRAIVLSYQLDKNGREDNPCTDSSASVC
jgi:hypothetical protein